MCDASKENEMRGEAMEKQLPPMIFVIFLWRMGQPLPPYFADTEPDMRAVTAQEHITHAVCRRAYLRYD